MIQVFLNWLAGKLPPPRIIWDRNGKSPYLSRFYLVNPPRMPDGSWPFDKNGALREGITWPTRRWGIYLHKFHRGDDERELHNHPWRWAVSLILSGGYIEERRHGRDYEYVVRVRRFRPGMINIIRSSDFHRVDLVGKEAWSLFLVGPKFSSWGFWCRNTGRFWPWRQFISELRDPTSSKREAAE